MFVSIGEKYMTLPNNIGELLIMLTGKKWGKNVYSMFCINEEKQA